MNRTELVEKLREEIPVLLSDLNRTLVYVEGVPNLRIIKNYTANVINSIATGGPLKGTKKDRIYVSEFLKDVLSDNKIGKFKPAACRVLLTGVKRQDFEEANLDILKYHEIPDVKKFLTAFKKSGESKKTMLISRHTYTGPFVDYFGFDYKASNDTCFESDGSDARFAGFWIQYRKPKDKLNAAEKELNKINLSVSDCAVLVDGNNDIPLIDESALSLASPRAKPKIKGRVDYPIKNFQEYAVIARMLEEEMPKIEPLRV
jgi:phosphoserine phosphatase